MASSELHFALRAIEIAEMLLDGVTATSDATHARTCRASAQATHTAATGFVGKATASDADQVKLNLALVRLGQRLKDGEPATGAAPSIRST